MFRCTGHCCRKIHVNGPHGYMTHDTVQRVGSIPKNGVVLDEHDIIHKIEIDEFVSNNIEFCRNLAPDGKDSSGDVFKCNKQMKNGDCSIYLNRPKTCSNYPGKISCPISGCTYLPEHTGP